MNEDEEMKDDTKQKSNTQ